MLNTEAKFNIDLVKDEQGKIDWLKSWDKLGAEFENKSAKETLEYSLTTLLEQGDVIFLTAFGPEGCVLFQLIYEIFAENPELKTKIAQNINELGAKDQAGKFAVANLDTGYQFKETIELAGRLEAKYGFKILMVEPELTVAQQDEKFGKDLYKTDPDSCCYKRKLVPLFNLLDKKLAWITSIRREQTAVRAKAKAFEFDKKFKLGKINPLIHFTKSDIWKAIHEHGIPYNPLLDEGFDSIGCEPCTVKGEGRQGRWAGKDKIECGLHIQDDEQKQGGEFVI